MPELVFNEQTKFFCCLAAQIKLRWTKDSLEEFKSGFFEAGKNPQN